MRARRRGGRDRTGLVGAGLIGGSVAVFCFVGVSFVMGVLPSRAAGHNPADTLLDRAREAIERHEFRATVRIWWRDAEGPHATKVAVVAVDGGLRLANGRVVEHDGHSWIRSNQRWKTLWSDTADPRAPSIAEKYSVVTRAGPRVIGRPTSQLTVRRHGRLVERMVFDRSLGLVLRRVQFDAEGAVSSQVELVWLGEVRDRHGELDVPKVGAGAPELIDRVPSDAPRSLGDGFVLVDARRLNDETQLRYSDGVFEVSIFARPGELDWSALPDGGRDVRYGPVRARRYRTSAGTVIVWQARARMLTCVTDATSADQGGIVEDLTREHESTWTGVVRFVTSPFRWT